MVRVLAIALLICSGATPSGAQVVASPSEQVRTRFMPEDGRPQYTLLYRGNEVIAPSTLGIDFANASALDGPFEIADTERAPGGRFLVDACRGCAPRRAKLLQRAHRDVARNGGSDRGFWG